ncbi:MAG: hypothetical protein AB7F43_08025 [Bacteriovoracia bacterium]
MFVLCELEKFNLSVRKSFILVAVVFSLQFTQNSFSATRVSSVSAYRQLVSTLKVEGFFPGLENLTSPQYMKLYKTLCKINLRYGNVGVAFEDVLPEFLSFLGAKWNTIPSYRSASSAFVACFRNYLLNQKRRRQFSSIYDQKGELIEFASSESSEESFYDMEQEVQGFINELVERSERKSSGETLIETKALTKILMEAFSDSARIASIESAYRSVTRDYGLAQKAIYLRIKRLFRKIIGIEISTFDRLNLFQKHEYLERRARLGHTPDRILEYIGRTDLIEPCNKKIMK